MQRKILKPQWILSILSVAMLAACGGGGMGTFSPNDPRNKTKNSNQTDTKSGVQVNRVSQNEPTVEKFLTNVDGIGQQNSPIVASVDNNDNKKIDTADRVSFNQPGLVSEIFGTGSNNSGTNASPRTMRDINNISHEIVFHGTVDLNEVARQATGKYAFPHDAGTIKINKKRVNGGLEDYGGTIDRRFNEIMLFTRNQGGQGNSNDYLAAYFRSPGMAGWSYQTFGYFFGSANNGFLDRSRDAFVGYQSIGRPTLPNEMPTTGSAEYSGLAHGYYNGNQVTSLNRIHADFGTRSLNYETTGASQLHTFEGDDKNVHVVEDKPQFNLTGTATWGERSGDFSGPIRTAEGLSGSMQGRFYGDNAQEIGGVFGMQGVATDGSAVQYLGGFGGRRY